jgi:hypothetical protein
MPSSVEDLCRHLASAFAEGRLEDIPDHYIYPLAIYLPDGIRIEMSPRETAEAVFLRRTVALKAGMRSVRVRIAGVTEMQGGRIPVSLSWEFLDANGRRIGLSSMRYFCRRSADGTLRVEMIEFTEIAFADAVPRPSGGSLPN